jgi:hypothetical protein
MVVVVVVMGDQRHAPAALPPGMTRYLLYRRLGGPTGPVWTGAENLAPTGIRSPDSRAHSEPLYRLQCPGPHRYTVYKVKRKVSSYLTENIFYSLSKDQSVNVLKGRENDAEYLVQTLCGQNVQYLV